MYKILYLRVSEIEMTSLRQVVLIELNSAVKSDSLRQVELIRLSNVN